MDSFVVLIFWVSLGTVLYAWALYPATVRLLTRGQRTRNGKTCPQHEEDRLPFVSVVVAAYNEEHSISHRLQNLSELVYPPDRLEVIVVSDGSTDRTVGRARDCSFPAVRVIELQDRGGKAAAHNAGVSGAKGDIVVLTDAETLFDRWFLRAVTHRFTDPQIGCVIGCLRYARVGESGVEAAERSYFSYEVRLREAESALGILIAATGAAMCFRHELFQPLRDTEDADVFIPLAFAAAGYMNVFARDALAYDVPPSSVREEVRYRARDTAISLATTLRVLRARRRALLRRPGVLCSIVSHRILRWATPLLLITGFAANCLLVNRTATYKVLFGAQAVFYGLAVIDVSAELFGLGRNRRKLLATFLLANAGIVIGVLRLLRGRGSSIWES